MRELFGTDGIRGKANTYPMTSEIVLSLGKAISLIFRNASQQKILIGKDTRLSGYMLENALVSGICSMGGDAYLVGPLPTPGIAFLTGNMRVDAGVVISASHNPFEDNGIKIFSSDGYKLPDKLENEIEDLILKNNFKDAIPDSRKIGRAFRIDDAIGRYVVYLKTTFPRNLDLKKLKIVIDCANGATYKVAPEVFYELGAEVISIGVEPNGTNINDACGSTNTRKLRATVISREADLGISFDGDGDRCILVDENGDEIDGDHIIAAAADFMKREGSLKNNTVVLTPMSNIGLEKFLEKSGINIVKSDVGDRYVVEQMLKGDLNFGGEPSGHIVFRDFNTTGDGILTALQFIKIMLREKKKASELKKIFNKFPQLLKNIEVPEKVPLKAITGLEKKINEYEKALDGRGRIFIRYSGTEKKLRIMIEGDDLPKIRNMIDSLEKTVRDFFTNKF